MNQNPQQPLHTPSTPSMDYLNSIAAPEKTATMNPMMLWGTIGGVLLLVIIFVLVIMSSGGPSLKTQFSSYVSRVQAVEKVMKSKSKTIQSSELRALNSSTLSILGTADQESTEIAAGLGTEKKSDAKTSTVATEFEELNVTLDEAELNVRFDQTYARELAYQLAKIRAELNRLSKQSSNSSLREYIKKTDTNLKPLVEQFNDYNNSQS